MSWGGQMSGSVSPGAERTGATRKRVCELTFQARETRERRTSHRAR